jgi:hypothetical protein
MAYSYVAKDGNGEDYVTLSEDVEKKVYFAGEVRFLIADCEDRSVGRAFIWRLRGPMFLNDLNISHILFLALLE